MGRENSKTCPRGSLFLLKHSTQPLYIAAVIPLNEEQDQLFLPVYLLPDPALIQEMGTHKAAAFLNLANLSLFNTSSPLLTKTSKIH